MIKVTIIIPTYHDWDRLNLCLKALVEQSYPSQNVQIIVANNDPDDKAPLGFVIPGNCVIIDEAKAGSYAARNAALKLATGDVVGFTDSDCIPDIDWIKNALFLFDNDREKQIGVVTGKVKLFYKNPKHLNIAETYEKYTAFQTDGYAKNGRCITANWFSYTNVINNYGPFNAELKSGGDMGLSFKISKHLKIIYSEDVIINHPARNSLREIIKKYVRVLGGIFIKSFNREPKPFLKFILKGAYYRWRDIIKAFPSRPITDSLKLLIVNNWIIIISFQEYYLLTAKKQDTKR
jgi:glycosyltransferase involved in cell wall biosynthesis